MRTKAMTKEEQEYYSSKTPIAVYPVSNWGGVEILDILYGTDDYVVCRYNFGEPEKKLHRVKVQHNKGGIPFIFLDGSYVRLDECLAV